MSLFFRDTRRLIVRYAFAAVVATPAGVVFAVVRPVNLLGVGVLVVLSLVLGDVLWRHLSANVKSERALAVRWIGPNLVDQAATAAAVTVLLTPSPMTGVLVGSVSNPVAGNQQVFRIVC